MRLVAFILLFSQIAVFTNSVMNDRPDDGTVEFFIIGYCFALMASALYLFMS